MIDLSRARPERPPDCQYLRAYLQWVGDHQPCLVELTPNTIIPNHIDRLAVVQLGPNRYRMVILFHLNYPGGINVTVKDGTRVDLGHALRLQRIPLLRIAPPQ